MKATIKVEQEVDLRELHVEAKVRYWEDAEINEEAAPESGEGVPFAKGEMWTPVINLETGRIKNWPKGMTAAIHFKVCDAGSYYLKDENGKTVLSIEQNYVPGCLAPDGSGFGDYIILDIDSEGVIKNWSFGEDEIGEFQSKED